MAQRWNVTSAPVTRFGLAGLAAVVALGALTFGVVSRISQTESRRFAIERAELAARGIIEPALEPAVTTTSPQTARAISRLDILVQSRVLSEKVIRVKLWTPEGKIVYSDEPRLIGKQYSAKRDHAEAIESGRTSVEIADLDGPENAYEREAGRLLEVYLPIRTFDGRQLIYEQYERYDSITSNANSLLRRLAIPLGAGLALLWLTQLPLARAMARRIRSSEAERAEILELAVTASERERERIAADLHDGPVQDLAGLTFELAAATPSVPAGELRDTLDRATNIARATMQNLRSSLVDLHASNLHSLGLQAAIDSLLENLRHEGTTVISQIDVPELTEEQDMVLYRSVQEFIRNIEKHANATAVSVKAFADAESVVLTVKDNGTGFNNSAREQAQRKGHVGLVLHEAIVRRAGGRIAVESQPGKGTVATVEVPR